MKLKTGQPRYRFPAHSRIQGAHIVGNQRHNQMNSIMLSQIRRDEWSAVGRTRGIPTWFAIYENTIEFFPIPDKPYVVKVQFYPPIQEF